MHSAVLSSSNLYVIRVANKFTYCSNKLFNVNERGDNETTHILFTVCHHVGVSAKKQVNDYSLIYCHVRYDFSGKFRGHGVWNPCFQIVL